MSKSALFGLNAHDIEKINTEFKKYAEIQEVIIYGSRAKGNFKPNSDIDLTIKAPKLSTSDLLKIEELIDDLLLPYKVDLSLHHQIQDSEILDHISRVGLIFYYKD